MELSGEVHRPGPHGRDRFLVREMADQPTNITTKYINHPISEGAAAKFAFCSGPLLGIASYKSSLFSRIFTRFIFNPYVYSLCFPLTGRNKGIYILPNCQLLFRLIESLGILSQIACITQMTIYFSENRILSLNMNNSPALFFTLEIVNRRPCNYA